MKCIHCGGKTKYSDRRYSRRCSVCKREFAFEPREGGPLSDLGFKYAIDAVSDMGRLKWTDAHLYYDVARRVRRRRLIQRLLRRPLVSIGLGEFENMLERWISVHGQPPDRLAPRTFADGVRDDDLAREIEDYAFENLVVCDDDGIVDVLLANGFHVDNRCAVLSVSGYPDHAFEALMPLLRRHPPARVFAVHDADPEGCKLAARIADDPRWFAGVEAVEVIDAGLRPADATPFRGLFLEGSVMSAAAENTSLEEREWLSKFHLELEAVRPRALLGVLANVVRHGIEARQDGAKDRGPWGTDGPWAFRDDDDPG
jgi:hypothetical protein